MTRLKDVVIIGAGPAGMACAIEAAAKGLSTIVLDENPQPGGQIYRAIESASENRLRVLGHDYARGRELASEFRQSSGVDYRPDSTVWNIGPDRLVEFSRDGKSSAIRASHLVVATGAIERPCPLPGWTLPGVTTAGALQILLKTSGIIYQDTVLTGSGPLLWLLAAQMVDAGSPPKAIVETVPRGRLFNALPELMTALGAREYLLKGMSMIRKVKRAGVRIHVGADDIAIEGSGAVSAIRFRSKGTEHRIATDSVALHQGVVPNQQVTRLLGCRHFWDDSQKCFRPKLSEDRETSCAHVYVAGDGGGIEGAKSAEMQGRLVGLAIAEKEGHGTDPRIAELRLTLKREAHVRPFLEKLYAPSRQILHPDDATVICRCEEVTAGSVREAVAQGAPGPNQVKSFLRTGMGPCQGRICGLVVTSVISESGGKSPDDVDYYRIRPPLKPLPLAELADYSADMPDSRDTA